MLQGTCHKVALADNTTQPQWLYLVDIVFSLLSLPDSVLDHGSGELGVVQGVDQHFIIQDVALGLLQQLQDLVLQLLPTQCSIMSVLLLYHSNCS